MSNKTPNHFPDTGERPKYTPALAKAFDALIDDSLKPDALGNFDVPAAGHNGTEGELVSEGERPALKWGAKIIDTKDGTEAPIAVVTDTHYLTGSSAAGCHAWLDRLGGRVFACGAQASLGRYDTEASARHALDSAEPPPLNTEQMLTGSLRAVDLERQIKDFARDTGACAMTPIVMRKLAEHLAKLEIKAVGDADALLAWWRAGGVK